MKTEKRVEDVMMSLIGEVNGFFNSEELVNAKFKKLFPSDAEFEERYPDDELTGIIRENKLRRVVMGTMFNAAQSVRPVTVEEVDEATTGEWASS